MNADDMVRVKRDKYSETFPSVMSNFTGREGKVTRVTKGSLLTRVEVEFDTNTRVWFGHDELEVIA